MNTINPDKWIRKAVIDALATESYTNIYDERIPTTTNIQNYIILSTQTKVENKNNKCSSIWDATILLDIVTRFSGVGNSGDKEQVNDIEETVIKSMNVVSIDNFQIISKDLESSTTLNNLNDTENVYRQLVRYRFLISEKL
jgi:hypothetical protein